MNTIRSHNNSLSDVCAWNEHNVPAVFVVTNREGDNWSSCVDHLAQMTMFMADHAPLTLEPIFSNFPAQTRSPATLDFEALTAEAERGYDVEHLSAGVHKASPSSEDSYHCSICGQRIKAVSGGRGRTYVHADSGAVAAPNPPKGGTL